MNRSSKNSAISTIHEIVASCVERKNSGGIIRWFTDGHSFKIKDGVWKEGNPPFDGRKT